MLKRIFVYVFVAWLFSIAIYAIVAVMARHNVQNEQEQRLASTVSDAMDEVYAKAKEQAPNATGLDAVDATNQALVEQAGSRVDSMPTDAGKRRIAISNFIGFYYGSTIAWPEYCRKFGVDIPTYVNAFKDVHKEELAIALANDVDVEAAVRDSNYVNAISAAVAKATEENMQKTAQQWGLSATETCKELNKSGVELAEGMRLSTMAPEVYAAMRL